VRESRRQFLRLLGGAGALLAGAGRCGSRAFAAEVKLRVAELRGAFVIAGAGGNVVVLPTSGGALMVDSGTAAEADELLAVVAERAGPQPVACLFNTHWHLDHTGGNDAVVARGAPAIVAHENTRLWMSTKFYVDWEDRYYPRRESAVLPNRTFFSSDPQPLELMVGDERVLYGHLAEAHTDGDIYVRFPERNLIVAGGAVTAGRYPVLDYITGGWIGGLVDATRTLLELSDADTVIVPDVGPPQVRSSPMCFGSPTSSRSVTG